MTGPFLSNPADRPLVTLDTNILIALRNNEKGAVPAQRLLAFNRAGMITINVTLSTALEEQPPSDQLDMQAYAAWLQGQGVAVGNTFTGPRTIGFHLAGTDPNVTTFDMRLEMSLNRYIHQSLFPNIPFYWFDYLEQECNRLRLTEVEHQALIELERSGYSYIPPTPQSPARLPTPTFDALDPVGQEELRAQLKHWLGTWRNAKNDALGLFNHLTNAMHTAHPEWAVFVTEDRNFRKQSRLAALRQCHFPGEILPAEESVAFICQVLGVPLPV